MSQDELRFDGETYEPEHDRERLSQQLATVRELMRDGQWRTLSAIATAAHASTQSVSARLRDLRKARFGGWEVERVRLSGGVFYYRLLPPALRLVDQPPEPAPKRPLALQLAELRERVRQLETLVQARGGV